jgi:hypothetical protein
MTRIIDQLEDAMYQRDALVGGLSTEERKAAIGLLDSLGAYVYDNGVDIGKSAAILLAHRFLQLADKVTELKNMIDVPGNPTAEELSSV